MTRQWAATNTLREALLGKALEYNPRGQNLLTEEAAALALVEAALDAAENRLGPGHDPRCNLMKGNEWPCSCGYDALDAALRAVREGK